MNPRKKNLIDALAEELHRRRIAIVGEVDETEGDLKTITQERAPELEEDAQKDRIATVLERLSDRDRQTLEETDEAIQRIVDGTYGKCASCGSSSSLARLRALPATRLCIDCARAREGQESGDWEEEPEETRMPPDLSLLDDAEIEATRYELVRESGGIDMEELRISSRDGVVYLEGALPSEEQHHVLTELLQDVGGLGDIVDRLEIQRLPWEGRERSKAQSAEEQQATGARRETEDVVKSVQEGTPYRPPLKPPPDEEKE
jgi:RNA polymerase-binding protein DksA